jgi:hypothetical protein
MYSPEEFLKHAAECERMARFARQAGYRKSVDYWLTIVSEFLSNLLHANQSLSHANRVSGRSFPALRQSISRRAFYPPH